MNNNHKSGFRQAFLDFPKQFDEAIALSKDFNIQGEFKHILVAGMGGSAWPAEILDTWLKSESGSYVSVIRDYDLPLQLPEQTLVVISSYSGNTEEPLTVYQRAKKRNLPLAAICSGGLLKECCEADNVPYIEIPQGLVPRMATGYLFTALARIVFKAIPSLKSDSLSLTTISLMAKKLKPAKLDFQSKELAKKLKNKIPLIYTPENLKVLGYVWKIKLNEGVKIPAFCNSFPELNHNEFSIFTDPEFQGINPVVIIFKDPEDDAQLIKRIDLSAEIIEQKDVPVEIITVIGENMLEKIFANILLSDWLTYYLAEIYNIDPLTTDLQEKFKKQMAS